VTEEVKPGIHRNIPEQVYRAWPYPSQTNLKVFVNRSAAHARYQLLHPSDPTPAQEMGTATHTAMLEPKRFQRTYAAAPEGLDKRTKAGKASWAKLVASGRTILRAEEYDHIDGMSAAIWAHPVASELLSGEGANELSIVWDEHLKAGPVRCKARVDRLTYHEGWPTVVDLKKTRDASPRNFIWDIGRYGYHIQIAMYLRALEAATEPMERRFIILAVEDEPPHGIVDYELDAQSLAEAQGQLFDCLEQWAECVASDEWPGYPPKIHGVTLPEKYWRK
jgi:exodeoxyribonuclease VIII